MYGASKRFQEEIQVKLGGHNYTYFWNDKQETDHLHTWRTFYPKAVEAMLQYSIDTPSLSCVITPRANVEYSLCYHKVDSVVSY